MPKPRPNRDPKTGRITGPAVGKRKPGRPSNAERAARAAQGPQEPAGAAPGAKSPVQRLKATRLPEPSTGNGAAVAVVVGILLILGGLYFLRRRAALNRTDSAG